MEKVNQFEVKRQIGYLQWQLLQVEGRMLKEQSERMDIKGRLTHLHSLESTALNAMQDRL